MLYRLAEYERHDTVRGTETTNLFQHDTEAPVIPVHRLEKQEQLPLGGGVIVIPPVRSRVAMGHHEPVGAGYVRRHPVVHEPVPVPFLHVLGIYVILVTLGGTNSEVLRGCLPAPELVLLEPLSPVNLRLDRFLGEGDTDVVYLYYLPHRAFRVYHHGVDLGAVTGVILHPGELVGVLLGVTTLVVILFQHDVFLFQLALHVMHDVLDLHDVVESHQLGVYHGGYAIGVVTYHVRVHDDVFQPGVEGFHHPLAGVYYLV